MASLERPRGAVRRAVVRLTRPAPQAACSGDAAPSRGAEDFEGAADWDDMVEEEPLEIRIAGDPVATTMRTPGEDHELAAGFLLAEGLVTGVRDIGSIVHCGRPGEPAFGNVVDVLPGPGVALSPERAASVHRGTLITSACGVCGRRSIEDLARICGRFEDDGVLDASLLARMVEGLPANQPRFARTGGMHAAAILNYRGEVCVAREDVGRHNAVDKAIGALLLRGKLPLHRSVLVVSGRVAFEIVQKAYVARIPIVASVSAASSLAIDLARTANITLASFVREGRMNVCAGEQRLRFGRRDG